MVIDLKEKKCQDLRAYLLESRFSNVSIHNDKDCKDHMLVYRKLNKLYVQSCSKDKLLLMHYFDKRG